MIYLDNAATTPLDGDVLRDMAPYLCENFGNPSSQHAYGRTAASAVMAARDKVARIFGCAADEVFFTSCGTEADNWAVKGVARALADKGRHVVVSAIEHPAVLESAKDLQNDGFEVTFVSPDRSGIVSARSVKSALRKDTVLCAVMAANNETGAIQPISEIGQICRENGTFFFSDCVQTAGVLPLPAGIADAFSVSAHKFYGPKGAGALYLKRGSRIARLLSGGHQERGLRGGTTNAAAIVGLACALDRAYVGADENNAKIKAVRDLFLKRALEEIEGVHLNGDPVSRLPSNVNLSFDGCDGENILFLLDLKGIAVSTGSACSSGAVTPSHVLTAMGYSAARAKSAVRFTFGKYNTAEEAEETVRVLKSVVADIRKIRG